MIDLLLGWTMVGWVIALAMAVSGARPQRAPQPWPGPYQQEPYQQQLAWQAHQQQAAARPRQQEPR